MPYLYKSSCPRNYNVTTVQLLSRFYYCTYTNQSTAHNKETSLIGALMALNTISIRTRAALGTLAAAIDVAVAVKTTVTRSPAFKGMSLICAIKIEATVTNKAVPSILTVAPIGNTNFEILGSILFFSDIHLNVMGNAAALKIQQYMN